MTAEAPAFDHVEDPRRAHALERAQHTYSCRCGQQFVSHSQAVAFGLLWDHLDAVGLPVMEVDGTELV